MDDYSNRDGDAGGVAAGAVVEHDVELKTPAGTADAAFFHPSGSGPWPGVLLWPDAFGLRPAMRDMGRRLSAEGYAVLVPNPFYRTRKAPVFSRPMDFAVPADREEIMKVVSTTRPRPRRPGPSCWRSTSEPWSDRDQRSRRWLRGATSAAVLLWGGQDFRWVGSRSCPYK